MSAAERALVRALLERGGPDATLVHADAQPWASLTFEGERHLLELDLADGAAARFIDGLEDADLPLPGRILADLVVEEQHAAGPGRTRLRVAALTLLAA